MSKKLNNIKAVKEMIAGTHKSQTKTNVSFGEKASVRREIGETWTDENGQEWKQKQGYRVKLGKMSKLRTELKTFPNCPKEVCTCTSPGQADKKMKAFHGMCLDCVTEMEHKLRLDGKYDIYEKERILKNAEAWLKQAEKEKDIIKSTLQAAFINEDGSIEEWGGLNEEEVMTKIENDFEKFKKNYIEKLKKDLEDELHTKNREISQ